MSNNFDIALVSVVYESDVWLVYTTFKGLAGMMDKSTLYACVGEDTVHFNAYISLLPPVSKSIVYLQLAHLNWSWYKCNVI